MPSLPWRRRRRPKAGPPDRAWRARIDGPAKVTGQKVYARDSRGPGYANDIGEAFRAWPEPQSISTRGNTCTSGHRIGSMNSCQELMLQSVGAAPTEGLDGWGKLFPQSHGMPPGDLHTERQWTEIFGSSVAALSACCECPDAPGCSLSSMPKVP